MNEGIMLSEISETEKYKNYMISLIQYQTHRKEKIRSVVTGGGFGVWSRENWRKWSKGIKFQL